MKPQAVNVNHDASAPEFDSSPSSPPSATQAMDSTRTSSRVASSCDDVLDKGEKAINVECDVDEDFTDFVKSFEASSQRASVNLAKGGSSNGDEISAIAESRKSLEKREFIDNEDEKRPGEDFDPLGEVELDPIILAQKAALMDREVAASKSWTRALARVRKKMFGAIPATEWGMPMTLWAIKPHMSFENLKTWISDGIEGLNENEVMHWEIADKPATEKELRDRRVIIIEQGPNAVATAKLALGNGKFVLWSARGELDEFAVSNARGVVEGPTAAERSLIRLEELRAAGMSFRLSDGSTLEKQYERIGAMSLSHNVRDAVCEAIKDATNKPWEAEINEIKPEVWARIERMLEFSLKDYPETVKGDPKTLAELVGLAPSTRQHIERLIRRASRKHDVDQKIEMGQGVLLHGLPGTGKTMIAKIIAIESGRAFIDCSYADWQATDDLGDHLRKMAASFNEAMQKAPSIMLIDELDSIGSRKSTDRNALYSNNVINAMLEWIQLALRSGVTIVAASNYPKSIDDAITRPGRLGHWVEIPYPEVMERAEIFNRVMPTLKNPLAWARRVGRASPAKIVQLAEEAKELARERGSFGVEEKDLERAMSDISDLLLAGRSMKALAWPVSVGLCAKARALVLATGDAGIIEQVVLEPGLESIGRVDVELGRGADLGSGAQAWARLQIALAPAAARVEIARAQAHGHKAGAQGAFGALASLDESERGEARSSAWELSSAGFVGGAREWLNPEKGFEAVVQRGWEAALSSAAQGRGVIEAAARELVRRGAMSGREIMELMGFEVPGEPELVEVSALRSKMH